MPTATKFWLIFPAIVLLAMSVFLYLRWPFRIASTENDDPPSPDVADRLRPLTPPERKRR